MAMLRLGVRPFKRKIREVPDSDRQLRMIFKHKQSLIQRTTTEINDVACVLMVWHTNTYDIVIHMIPSETQTVFDKQ